MGTAWDIYAQRLMHLGYGHPLWGPEPSERFGEIRLGDVGYLQDGHFCFLFNAMQNDNDPVNSRGVPDNFVVFDPPDSTPVHQSNEITQTQLHSKNLRSVEIAATVAAGEAGPSASVGLRYRCNADSGALLLLKQPAHKTFLECNLRIKKYMVTHLASWCEFANDRLGIELEDKDIIFVSGFIKTTVWAEAAFSNNSDNGELVIAGGCFVPSASGEFRVSISRGIDASVASRVGPHDRVSPWKDDNQDFKYDQCIFLNYYKMKSRGMLRRPRVMRAAAGPHTLPDQDDDDDSPDICSSPPAPSDSEESDHVGKNYDPVNEILDYILKHSTAEVACASDQDLSSLFGTHGVPSNLQVALEALAPQIIPDGSGIGTISLLSQVDYKARAPSTHVGLAPHLSPFDQPSDDRMQGLLSSLSSALHIGNDRFPPVQEHPSRNTQFFAKEDDAENMAFDERRVKNKNRLKESFIIVREPPSKTNRPLNLQLQLVPPSHPNHDINRSLHGRRLRGSSIAPEVDGATSVTLRSSNQSEVSLHTAYSSTLAATSTSSACLTTSSAQLSTPSPRRMILPLYTLQVRTNIIVDAGTDARVAKFQKRGLEVVGLAILEPIEVWGDGGNPTPLPGHSLKMGTASPPTSWTHSSASDEYPHTPAAVSPFVAAPASPRPSKPRNDTPSVMKFFNKLLMRRPNSPVNSPSFTPLPLPITAQPPFAQSATVFLQPPILGIQPSLSATTFPPGGRPTKYVWVVRQWLKRTPENLQWSSDPTPAQSLVDVRFEWSRGKSGRGGKDRARSNLHSSTTLVDQDEDRSHMTEDGDESDPMNSETPWVCTFVVHSAPGAESAFGSPEANTCMRTIASLMPTPHHPKVVALLKMPFSLLDIDIERGSVRERIVTSTGGPQPAPCSDEQPGKANWHGKRKGTNDLKSFFAAKGPAGHRAGADLTEGLIMTAEEIKDVVSSTALWLVVREGFGGVGRASRKGDGVLKEERKY